MLLLHISLEEDSDNGYAHGCITYGYGYAYRYIHGYICKNNHAAAGTLWIIAGLSHEHQTVLIQGSCELWAVANDIHYSWCISREY